LFTASFGTYDPLIQECTSNILHPETEEQIPSQEDYRHAQWAVAKEKWEEWGVSGSGKYLQKIFEDDGRNIISLTRDVSFCL
jgi:hypothetical protein